MIPLEEEPVRKKKDKKHKVVEVAEIDENIATEKTEKKKNKNKRTEIIPIVENQLAKIVEEASEKKKKKKKSKSSEEGEEVQIDEHKNAKRARENLENEMQEIAEVIVKKSKKEKKDARAECTGDESTSFCAPRSEKPLVRSETPETSDLAEEYGNGDEDDGYYNNSGGARYWKRIDESKYISKVQGTKFANNSHFAKGGDSWGSKAAEDLGRVKGKDFRKEMMKKKRAGWSGAGTIDMGVNSVVFSDFED